MSDMRDDALHYHRWPSPGKLEVVAKKPLANQRDLALAYSPGVAAACDAIVEHPAEAATVTGRANLVGVVTNGTAVLGLGPIGALASKPVMEGKAVLFKKFADIDVFDIEISETEPEKFIEIVAALEPTFGAINLEDIKGPDCFLIEKRLREKLSIPVFHDDQHGTAIVVAAAVSNGLSLVNKNPSNVKVVAIGGGAAGIACLNQLLAIGIKRKNIVLVDRAGVVYKGRKENITPQKVDFAADTKARTLAEAISGADVFLGLSAPGVLTPQMVKTMARRPLILALANPEPEIRPELVREVVPDAIIATGRSDYPNQVNNVLCFPFIFRAALDVGASTINDEMKIACVKAIADLAKRASSEVVSAAYGGEKLVFGSEYLIPKPFDPRLISEIAPAVARAAMDSGVATRPIEDLESYREKMDEFVYRSTMVMRPVFEQAKLMPKRVVFGEGEDIRVLYATKVLLDDGIAQPFLVGRPEVIASRISDIGLNIKPGRDIGIINPADDNHYDRCWRLYHSLMEHTGISSAEARTVVRTNTTVIAALMVCLEEADAMICGTSKEFHWHLKHVEDLLGLCDGVKESSALSLLVLDKGPLFICDTFVSENPTAEEVADLTVRAARKVEDFGIMPKIALISSSNFGSEGRLASIKMREALDILRRSHPLLEVEGEMQPDLALNSTLRERAYPNSRLKGAANLLIMPTLNAANVSLNLVRAVSGGLHVGPILIGVNRPAHITTPEVTSRGLVNLAALAVLDAQVENV